MSAIFQLAIRDLKKKWILALVMAFLFGITFASFLAIIAYKNSLSSSYYQLSQDWLIVQKSDGVGEIHGSRLSPEIGRQLSNLGYRHPIPEIHQVVGTSFATGTLMRGLSLEDYLKVSMFTIESGRQLKPGDPSRLVMVGNSLANQKEVGIGDTLKLRGRAFEVVGIFKTNTYQDNEAWISLADAQALLNYGEDTSIYLIPDGGKLREGDNLQNGISVGRKGETGNVFGHEISSFYNYMGMVAIFAGLATVITLTNLLWRLAWLRRHEFGIIRTLGFGRRSLVYYLFIQALIILIIGLAIGLIVAFSVIFVQTQKLSAFGMGVGLTWNLSTLLYAAGIFITILLMGIAFPVIRISNMSIPNLLANE